MTKNRISRHVISMLLGSFVIAALVLATAPESPAQPKKETGKTDPKTKTKEPKIEPPPATFPARKDAIDPAQGGVQHVTLIDDELKKGWKANSTYPSERCSDFEFIRRASLDIVGRIPQTKEIKKFMDQPEGKRRSWLINEMLDGKDYGYGAEFANNFANLWTILLITRSGSSDHAREQLHDWLYNNFKGDEKNQPDWSKVVHALISARGNTNEDQAANYLLHHVGEEVRLPAPNGKGAMDTAKSGRWDMIPATSRSTRLFLGIRTQCVQCHNHPFNGEWKQENFWGINAFLREVDTPRGKPQMVPQKKNAKGVKVTNDYELRDNPGFNTDRMVPFEPRNNLVLYTDPTFLDGKKIPKNFKGTRREALAQFVTASPFFAKAYVNRTWGHFFGKSFTKDAVDDFGDSNPASYPELLDQLSADWAKDYNHNPKVLVRWICNSQAYGLSSRANKWNDKMDDEVLFARMLLKPMNAEQMFESMVLATSPLAYGNEEKKKARKDFLDQMVVNFGNDEGDEGSFSGTVVQALVLMNGKKINEAITEKDGAVDLLVKKRGASYASLPFVIDDMYMQVLNRPATQKEKTEFMTQRMYAFRKGAGNPASLPATFWRAYYEDIMWALLNSNEFILNH